MFFFAIAAVIFSPLGSLAAVAIAARKAAGAVNYVGGGTIAFVSDGKAVFFIEKNTRLQAGHPVDALITGIDHVAWPMLSRFGRALPRSSAGIKRHRSPHDTRGTLGKPDTH